MIVKRGEESRPKDSAGIEGRDLSAVEGYEAAIKLAQVILLISIASSWAADHYR